MPHSRAIDESIAAMRNLQIGRDRGEIAPLINFAETVLGVGMQFLGYLIDEHDYEPQLFQVELDPNEESRAP